MSVGEPLVILAVLGAVALWSGWEHLAGAWRVLGVLGVLALGAVGLVLAAQPTGMGARWAEGEATRGQEPREKEERPGEDGA